MMNYSNFSVEDFTMDENFQEWVKYPNTENNLFWEKWLRQNSHKKEEVKQARVIILSMDFRKTAAEDVPKGLLLKKIQSTIHEGVREIPPNSKFINNYFNVAAVFIGLFISTATLFFLFNSSTEEYTTSYHEIKHLTLPDGSSVVLNANSSIQFNRYWGSWGDREVWLEGEAFFTVSHKKNNQKFLVRTEHLNVEVIGTMFNVKNRRNNIKVVLNSGKVKLNRKELPNEEIYMDPGELMEFSGDDKKFTKKTVDPEQSSSWRNHQLIFKATPLNEIAQTLEDNYGWKIRFEEEVIETYQFTGAVSTKDIRTLLFTISEVFNLEILEENNQMIFKHKK